METVYTKPGQLAAALADVIIGRRAAQLESASYRELAFAALHAVHELTLDLDRARAQHLRLLDEYRALREQLLRDRAA